MEEPRTRSWRLAQPATVLVLGLALASSAQAGPQGGSARLNAASGLSPSPEAAPPAALMGRLTVYPGCLDHYQMQASEVWTGASDHSGDDREMDHVSFHHGVAIEVKTAYNGRPLKLPALQKQEREAKELVAAINAVNVPPGRLLNLDGNIWTLDRFASQFNWHFEAGPVTEGRPTVRLQFVAKASIHPTSRMQNVLHHSRGEVLVDADSGQVLAGHFASQAPVSFGAGLLADINSFSGTFTTQPLPPLPAPVATSAIAGAAAPVPACRAMKTIVVHVRGRKLFHHFDGTETINYRLAR